MTLAFLTLLAMVNLFCDIFKKSFFFFMAHVSIDFNKSSYFNESGVAFFGLAQKERYFTKELCLYRKDVIRRYAHGFRVFYH